MGGPPVLTVALVALGTALATGLGALPFVLLRRAGISLVAISSAVAAGTMLAASVALVLEGSAYGRTSVAAGAVAGCAVLVLGRRLMRASPAVRLGTLTGRDAARAIAVVSVMTLHSATEGVGIGVAYGGGEALGAVIALAIAVHNVPEGVAISLMIVPRGGTVLSAVGWSVFSSLPQPLLAVPSFLFVEAFRPALPLGLGFAAGAMCWMVVTELLPDARRAGSPVPVAAALVVSFGAMSALQALLLFA
jgi:zinc transporter, ZIP family